MFNHLMMQTGLYAKYDLQTAGFTIMTFQQQ